jgi:hypothetical protein
MADEKEKPKAPNPRALIQEALDRIKEFRKDSESGRTRTTGPELLDQVMVNLGEALKAMGGGTQPAPTTPATTGAPTGTQTPPPGGNPPAGNK